MVSQSTLLTENTRTGVADWLCSFRLNTLDANLYRQPANGIPVINHSYINNGANSKTKLIHPEHTYECGNSCQLREKYVQGTLATYGLHSAETS